MSYELFMFNASFLQQIEVPLCRGTLFAVFPAELQGLEQYQDTKCSINICSVTCELTLFVGG